MPKNPLSIQRQLDILKGVRSERTENECEIDSEDGRGLRNLLKRQQESHKHHIDRIRHSQAPSSMMAPK